MYVSKSVCVWLHRLSIFSIVHVVDNIFEDVNALIGTGLWFIFSEKKDWLGSSCCRSCVCFVRMLIGMKALRCFSSKKFTQGGDESNKPRAQILQKNEIHLLHHSFFKEAAVGETEVGPSKERSSRLSKVWAKSELSRKVTQEQSSPSHV